MKEGRRISNETFANYLDHLYNCTDRRFPGLREISKCFRGVRNFNVYNVFRAGMAHRVFGYETVNMIERARIYLEKEEEEDPGPRWLMAS